jgi:hypothetical protein
MTVSVGTDSSQLLIKRLPDTVSLRLAPAPRVDMPRFSSCLIYSFAPL